jgi:hypothetical protein
MVESSPDAAAAVESSPDVAAVVELSSDVAAVESSPDAVAVESNPDTRRQWSRRTWRSLARHLANSEVWVTMKQLGHDIAFTATFTYKRHKGA